MNLPPALRVASEEAWLLDRQGFGVPPAAQNLALQRKHYTGLADSLQAMLTGYHQVVLGYLHARHAWQSTSGCLVASGTKIQTGPCFTGCIAR